MVSYFIYHLPIYGKHLLLQVLQADVDGHGDARLVDNALAYKLIVCYVNSMLVVLTILKLDGDVETTLKGGASSCTFDSDLNENAPELLASKLVFQFLTQVGIDVHFGVKAVVGE